jgi:hypothetical protein
VRSPSFILPPLLYYSTVVSSRWSHSIPVYILPILEVVLFLSLFGLSFSLSLSLSFSLSLSLSLSLTATAPAGFVEHKFRRITGIKAFIIFTLWLLLERVCQAELLLLDSGRHSVAQQRTLAGWLGIDWHNRYSFINSSGGALLYCTKRRFIKIHAE